MISDKMIVTSTFRPPPTHHATTKASSRSQPSNGIEIIHPFIGIVNSSTSRSSPAVPPDDLAQVLLEMIESSQSPNVSVEQWEETGAILTSVLDKYLHLCLSLGTGISQDETLSQSLATRIDLVLGSFHVSITQAIAKARSALAHARNKIRSPVYRLPAEVLSEIFSYALHQPVDPHFHTPMRNDLVKMYRTLHSLLGVCSAWKNALLARGSFWSLVPMIHPASPEFHLTFPQATGLSLERAGNADLHLAAIIPYWRHSISLHELTKHALRFRTVNIQTRSHSITSRIANIFKGAGTSGKLSELSLFRKLDGVPHNIYPRGHNYIIHPGARSRLAFNQILKSLSIFRLRGAPIYLNQALFSDRLVQLDLQDFTLGYDKELSKLMTALASATELQILKLISITTFPNPDDSQETSSLQIALPKLETLLLQDLYANTLIALLSSITSSTHMLTLHLTLKSRRVLPIGEQAKVVPVHDMGLLELIASMSIDTMLLEGGKIFGWMSCDELVDLLESVPGLKTLRVHNWNIEEEFCSGLRRPSEEDGSTYPHVQNLYITSSKIWDEDGFEDMVASYSGSLERMELGVTMSLGWGNEDEDDSIEWGPLQEDDDLTEWLEEHVPEFKLIDPDYEPKEFKALEWQLW